MPLDFIIYCTKMLTSLYNNANSLYTNAQTQWALLWANPPQVPVTGSAPSGFAIRRVYQNPPNFFKDDYDILRYPDGHEEEIFPASQCMDNLGNCYEMIPNSPYAKTKKTLQVYKKTKEPNGNTIQDSREILTTLVIPKGSQVRFENGETYNYRSQCVEMAVVKEQIYLDNRQPVNVSNSRGSGIHETMYVNGKITPNFNFRYNTGELVRPTNPFYSYDEWVNY
jgi:hypothetical protein